jgi:hypothetical protein
MARIRCLVLPAFIWALIACASAQTTVGVPPSNPASAGILWVAILSQNAPALKVRFTIEVDHRNTNRLSPLETRTIAQVPSVATVDGLLDAIRSALPEATVFRDEHNPGIVHIVESSLYRESKYIMNQKAAIHFTGTQDGLIVRLGQQCGHAIAQQRGFGASSGFSTSNSPTQIKVDATDFTYRSLVSDFAPWEDFGIILWQAEEQTGIAGKPIVLVSLDAKPGPPRVPKYLSLVEVLDRWGPNLSLHFTLERDPGSKTISDLVRINVDENFLSVQTAEDLFSLIRRKYPGVQILSDPSNPKIIHIVDSSLSPDSNIMDRRATFRFGGTFSSLLDKLQTDTGSALAVARDPTTRPVVNAQMGVNASNEKYRDILCEFASLRDMPPVLWAADYYHLDNRFVPGNKVQVVVGAVASTAP